MWLHVLHRSDQSSSPFWRRICRQRKNNAVSLWALSKLQWVCVFFHKNKYLILTWMLLSTRESWRSTSSHRPACWRSPLGEALRWQSQAWDDYYFTLVIKVLHNLLASTFKSWNPYFLRLPLSYVRIFLKSRTSSVWNKKRRNREQV